MRVLMSAAFAVAAAISVGTISSSAQARDYPFCIKAEWYLGGPGDCAPVADVSLQGAQRAVREAIGMIILQLAQHRDGHQLG